jgi:hypothetical protein
MSKYLEDIFNECLERIRQGESIESCLSSYPEYAAELEELLSTVLNVRWRASIAQPRPEFKARARAQFMGSLRYAQQVEQPKKPGIFSLQRAWVPALASVLILLFGTVGTAAASANAMPDQTLYHVKLATEQVRLTFTLSDEEKVKYNVKLAENRSQEIVFMAEKGETEQITAATDRLSKHLQEANLVIARIEEQEMKEESVRALTSTKPQPPEAATLTAPDMSKGEEQPPESEEAAPRNSTVLKELVRQSISRNVTSLDSALQQAPVTTRPAVQEAIEASKQLEPILQERSRPETTSEPVPVQPEKIEGVRPENRETQSSTETKELEIQIRPKTEPENPTRSTDTESEKIDESRTGTENTDSSTTDSTRDSSTSPTDSTGTSDRSSLRPLNSTCIVSTSSLINQQVTLVRK